MPVTLTTRVENELADLIDEIAKSEGMDRSTVIRRFLSASARDWLIQKTLEDYQNGKITLWQAAKKCGLSLWEMINEVKKREFYLPYDLEDLREDIKV